MLWTLSFYRPYRGICISCEDESLLPFQKQIVTCYSGYGRKWIIGLTSALSQGPTHRGLERYAEKKKSWRFSVSSVGRLLQYFPPFQVCRFYGRGRNTRYGSNFIKQYQICLFIEEVFIVRDARFLKFTYLYKGIQTPFKSFSLLEFFLYVGGVFTL